MYDSDAEVMTEQKCDEKGLLTRVRADPERPDLPVSEAVTKKALPAWVDPENRVGR